MRLQENGEVWVSWFVGYFIRIISSVGYHPKYSERWGVVSSTEVFYYYCIFLAAPEGVRVYFLVNPGKWRAAVALLPTSKYSIGAVLHLSPVMVHLF